MKPPLHIIYLSGFGMNYDKLRRRLLGQWHFRGVSVELVAMQWEGEETFEQKLARIDRAIDKEAGKRIVLLGESAGGSMAVHMYARRPGDVYRAVTLCGKNSHPETVGENYYRRSPAFRGSMGQLNKSINALSDEQRRHFVSIHPLYDPVVPVRETLLPGCARVRLPSVGHFFTIVLGLSVLRRVVLRAVRE